MPGSKGMCPDCKEKYFHNVVSDYHYSNSGLENVYLQNVEVERCKCGEEPLIRALPTLHKVIAFCFVYKPGRLRGCEIRFIRSALRLKSKDLAEKLSVTASHLSRIESGNDFLGEAADKLMRCRIALEFFEKGLFSQLFDGKALQELVDSRLPENKGRLALFLTYKGPYLHAAVDPVEFEFKEAA